MWGAGVNLMLTNWLSLRQSKDLGTSVETIFATPLALGGLKFQNTDFDKYFSVIPGPRPIDIR